MLNRTVIMASVMGLLLASGCAKKASPEPTESTPPPATTAEPSPPTTDAGRPTLTAAECEAKSGRVVGDIGDGAIHRPDYTCEGGKPPLGSISATPGEPVAIEGSVCCPAAP